MSIPELLERYSAALREAGATAAFADWSRFDPATDEEIAALSAETGCPLPEELVAWLKTLRSGLIFQGNYEANRASAALRDLRGTRELDFSRHFKNITSWKDGRFDDGRIAKTYWQPQWVPLARDGCGNAYCYDLAPGPRGRVGQIIAMEFQDGQGPYLAQWGSLEEMLNDHLERMEERAYTIDEEGFIEFD